VPYGEYGDAIVRALNSDGPVEILLPYQWDGA
jgi:hypothetical protein